MVVAYAGTPLLFTCARQRHVRRMRSDGVICTVEEVVKNVKCRLSC